MKGERQEGERERKRKKKDGEGWNEEGGGRSTSLFPGGGRLGVVGRVAAAASRSFWKRKLIFHQFFSLVARSALSSGRSSFKVVFYPDAFLFFHRYVVPIYGRTFSVQFSLCRRILYSWEKHTTKTCKKEKKEQERQEWLLS